MIDLDNVQQPATIPWLQKICVINEDKKGVAQRISFVESHIVCRAVFQPLGSIPPLEGM